MKATIFSQVVIITFALLITGTTLAQPLDEDDRSPDKSKRQHQMQIPDLTDEQQEQIKNLKVNHLETILPLQNELKEKEARLHTLSTAENADMQSINSLIEEIGSIKTQMKKGKAAHHQSIRQLLTDDQRILLDARPIHKQHEQHPPKPMRDKY